MRDAKNRILHSFPMQGMCLKSSPIYYQSVIRSDHA